MPNAKLSVVYLDVINRPSPRKDAFHDTPILLLEINEIINNQGYEQQVINSYFICQTDMISENKIITVFENDKGQMGDKSFLVLIKKIDTISVNFYGEILVRLVVEVLPKKTDKGVDKWKEDIAAIVAQTLL